VFTVGDVEQFGVSVKSKVRRFLKRSLNGGLGRVTDSKSGCAEGSVAEGGPRRNELAS